MDKYDSSHNRQSHSRDEGMEFRDEIKKRLDGLSRAQTRRFAWLCGVRVLPFLSADSRGFSYWKEEDRQKHLYAVFNALDVSFPGKVAFSAAHAAHAAANAANAILDDASAAPATAAAATNAAHATAYTIATAYAADWANDAAGAALFVGHRYFKQILSNDLEAIRTGDIAAPDKGTGIMYGNIWSHFLEDLNAAGCGYWARLYEDLFINRFVVNEEELERRLKVPDEIKAKGAAAVGQWLEQNDDAVKRIRKRHFSEPKKEEGNPTPDANDSKNLRYDEKHLNSHFPFLFVTANENEKAAFEQQFKKDGENYVKGAPYSFGMFGNYKVAWFHLPSQGTANADATILCGKVIEEVSPIAVIMLGIAFGANENVQKIGDVLVSKIILNYDSRKVRGNSTKYMEIPKEVGFQLFNAFSNNVHQWQYPSTNESERFKVIPGAILTGSALIDNYAFRKKLLTDFAEYQPVGGEMEAYGIYAQCRLLGVGEWIIVKSICDWGHDKQNSQKEEWQKTAADSAVSFCHCIFSLRGHNRKGIFDDLLPKPSPHIDKLSPSDTRIFELFKEFLASLSALSVEELKPKDSREEQKFNTSVNDGVFISGDKISIVTYTGSVGHHHTTTANHELHLPTNVTAEEFSKILGLLEMFRASDQAQELTNKDIRALQVEISEARELGHKTGWERLRRYLVTAADLVIGPWK